jgi:DNA-binding GntR family transcriptional regulator
MAGRPKSVMERAYGQIKNRIATLELAPGAAIDDLSLSEELGISRTPAREALFRLVTGEQLDVLEEIWHDGIAAVQADDIHGIVSANSAFHDRISEWSGNALLHEHLSMMKKRVRWCFSKVADVRGMASWNEHRRIIDALRARDPAHAATLMRAHTIATADVYRSRAADVVTTDGHGSRDGSRHKPARNTTGTVA